MANSGAKFASANLNKSYGPRSSSSHSSHQPFGGSYGQAARSGRPGSGGGGGGMVVLSRSKGVLQKAGPKLSVPPPLNLPSLRKEHERFDSAGSGTGAGSNAGPGGAPRPTSSGMGWTKPTVTTLQDIDGSVDGQVAEPGFDVGSKGNGSYMPPSARLGGVVGSISSSARSFPSVGKASVLRGEDFPSLQAALPVSSVSTQKQKDGLNHKSEQAVAEDSSYKQRDGYGVSALVDMRPQLQSSLQTVENGSIENGGENHGLGNSRMDNQAGKQEYFPGVLPLVRLNPRSDWADDERDTGHGFSDRGQDTGFRDRNFDFPRVNVLQNKPVYNQYERSRQRDDEAGKCFPSQVLKIDPYLRDGRVPSREGRENNSWRTQSFYKGQEVSNSRNGVTVRTSGHNRDTWKDTKYVQPHVGYSPRDGVIEGNRDSPFVVRDTLHASERQHWNHMAESFNGRGVERNTRDSCGSQKSSRYRETHAFPKSEKPLPDDNFRRDFSSAGFDDSDPFPGSLVGVVNKKKDVKSTDFHDPIRESFEAELERVQKMQELERRRIIEEQENALEQARREEEDKQRLIREEDELQRKLEEEAQEGASRAEQERLEDIRRSEEHRISREEEKRRVLMEEERRKQAAKQKLSELEAKIAQRQAEIANSDASVATAVVDEKVPAEAKDTDVSISGDFDNWEESERMVERITTSALSDSSESNRCFEMSSRPYFAREGSSGGPGRGNSLNSWRRGAFENGSRSSSQQEDQDIVFLSPRRDALLGGRVVPRKPFYPGAGYMPLRGRSKGGEQEAFMDEFRHQKDEQWNFSEHADLYHKNIEIDYESRDKFTEKYGDVRWGQGQYHHNPWPPQTERMYPNTEADELYSYGRPRYSMRQPRVLPPPLTSMERTSFRGVINEHPAPSTFINNDNYNSHAARSESTRQEGYYGSREEGFASLNHVDVSREIPENENQSLNKEIISRCDSQSSLSVTSPPNSPPHLSHDELDESPHFALAAVDGVLTRNQSSVMKITSKDAMDNASSPTSLVEDEEWTTENNDELQLQEEYYADEDSYQEDDELHEADDENLDLSQELENLHIHEESSGMVDNLVLGFDDGVEVKIPSDDYERNSRSEERGFKIPDASAHILEDQGAVKKVQGLEQNLQPFHGSSQMDGDSSSAKIHVSDQTSKDPVIQQTTASYTSETSNLLVGVDASSSSGIESSSGQATSSTSSQADPPIKLQFGLFSAPSLIPSPVPAIQIGSIQMPLHLHPPDILPMGPQSMSFVQASVPAHYNLNQKGGIPLPVQPSQHTYPETVMNEESHPSFALKPLDESCEDASQKIGSVSVKEDVTTNPFMKASGNKVSGTSGDKISPELVSQAGNREQKGTTVNTYLRSSKERVFEGQMHTIHALNKPVSSEKNFNMLRGQGPSSSFEGRRFASAVKGSNMRSNFPAADASFSDSSGFQRRHQRTVQRTEFRVRVNGDKRHLSGSLSANNSGVDDKSNFSGKAVEMFSRNESKSDAMSSKPLKQIVEAEDLVSAIVSSQVIDPGKKERTENERNSLGKTENITQSLEGSLKRNMSEEDVEAPLQSGVVRVFRQAGIEAPSDEDDFIEVRSKRQMLNDRREQREKEIKAKSRAIKPKRRHCGFRESTAGLTSLNKPCSPADVAPQNYTSDIVASEGHGIANKEVSAGMTLVSSQPMAPVGTPAVRSEPQADRKLHANVTASIVSSGGKDFGPRNMSESMNNVADNVTTSMISWGTTQITQQVMALTQTQLEEAMKPARFDTHIASVGGHSSTDNHPSLPSSSITMKDKSFSSSSPINSLLAGEKIQFGAVTSPTVLPPSSCALSHGTGVPVAVRSDMQISRNLSGTKSALFFGKDKNANHLSVTPCCEAEAEAEAAASAVAAAAISSGDETVENGVGSVTVSDAKNFILADANGITAGMTGDQQLSRQSGSVCLSVSLSADLSVETPISLWPPLPSPQNSSSHVLSHFPGGQPHFPFYEMNHMLGGPIFAFGPHEETSGRQSQTQKTTPSSGPLSSWQQSTMDSYCGPPAGFTGPFINPSGGIPAVQGPPKMVVYNHFAPVGQYGQVGLGFMGTTYIPSGKQPDWKHNPTSAAMGVCEGGMTNMTMASSQHNTSNMSAPVQHLAPGSPLMPIASPFAMFDVLPFQSAPEVSVQASWSNVPASPLHSVRSSLPLHQHADGLLPLQFGLAQPVDQSLKANRIAETQTSTTSCSDPSFTLGADATVTGVLDELGLVESLARPTAVGASSTQSGASQNRPALETADVGKSRNIKNNVSNNNKGQNNGRSQSSSQQGHSNGYSYHRGNGMSQRNMSGSEWSHRRMGYHSRNQSLGAEKGLAPSKVKQIYVAKQTPNGSSAAG